MKIKPLLCAAVMAVSCVVLPSTAQAETTYASPSELITDAIEVALSGVESSTYDTAIANMQSLLTVSGNDVSYDGTVIGYWDSTTSDVLYKDSSMTDKVLYNDGENIWRFEPTILAEILEDVNNDLIETIVPTTADWNKIIGKYDITLGNVTIPANQWVEVNPMDLVSEAISQKEYADIYQLCDKTLNNYKTPASLGFVTYLIDDTGKLYIQDQYNIVFSYSSKTYSYVSCSTRDKISSYYGSADSTSGNTSAQSTGDRLYVRLVLKRTDTGVLEALPVFCNVTNSDTKKAYISSTYTWDTRYTYLQVGDMTSKYEGDYSDVTVGFAVFDHDVGSNPVNSTNISSNNIISMLNAQPTSSKQQIGNTLLKRRLSKFSSLVEGDTIEVTPTAWTIYGLGGEESDFDTFLADQNMINPGDTADISAVADVESLGFSVILPTTLPIYVDKLNQVSVATNATVENKSGAAVELQTIEIQAKPDTGWTLITNGEPSKKRDTKEFTFTTSLTDGTILDTGEIKPFSYDAKLSPLTEGVESLDLASVLVTVDWAPEE